eukprot:2915818-Pleurochrysis_carterae.AAC.1
MRDSGADEVEVLKDRSNQEVTGLGLTRTRVAGWTRAQQQTWQEVPADTESAQKVIKPQVAKPLNPSPHHQNLAGRVERKEALSQLHRA